MSSIARLVAGCLLALSTTGCSSLIDPNLPAPIRPFKEPAFESEYFLYRPSGYARGSAWPLIVVCHDGFPDSPVKRMRAWTHIAEDFGFFVAAPTLVRPGRSLTGPNADELRAVARQNEARILSVVRHVQSGHSISDDRIFLHGWSGGADAALYTGLRHPELFRALAVSEPRCDAATLADAAAGLDPHQRVLVQRETAEIFGPKHADLCVAELHKAGADLVDDRSASVADSDTSPVVDHFLHVLRTVPWIKLRLLAGPSNNHLEVQFKLACSIRPKRVHWDFGDAAESDDAEPLHRYRKQGVYRVTVTVTDSDGREHSRAAHFTVPDAMPRANRLLPP